MEKRIIKTIYGNWQGSETSFIFVLENIPILEYEKEKSHPKIACH